MYSFQPENLNLPIHPGDKVWWINADSDNSNYDYEELEIEGIVLMRDRVCVLIDGDVLDIGSDVFLSKQEALSWADAHRKPSMKDRLNAAGWHKTTPPESGSYYVRYSEGDIQKVYYHDGTRNGDCAGFYPYERSYSRIRRPVREWAYMPDVDNQEHQDHAP